MRDLAPPTARGLLVAGFSALALWPFGFGSLDLVLFVVGLAGLVLVLLACLLAAATALVLRRRLRRRSTEPQRLETGSRIRTGFRVPALRRLPLLRLRWRWEEPAGVDVRLRRRGDELVEDVIARRRFDAKAIRRRFEVYDVFGLTRVALSRSEPVAVLALPNPGRLRSMPVVQSISAAEGMPHPSGTPEGDRMEIRRYAPGDSIRHIMWKTFARTRELNVRLPEKSVERARKTVAYLVTGPQDEPAAAAARVALESGALGDSWLFGTDGLEEPTAELDAALRAIARSGGRAGRPSGLAAFLERIRRQGEIHCVVFAPALPGAWTEEALAALTAFPGALSFVLATDGVIQARPMPLWRRLLYEPHEEEGIPAEQLTRLVRTLAGAGCSTVVVDRRSGRSFGRSYHQTLGATA